MPLRPKSASRLGLCYLPPFKFKFQLGFGFALPSKPKSNMLLGAMLLGKPWISEYSEDVRILSFGSQNGWRRILLAFTCIPAAMLLLLGGAFVVCLATSPTNTWHIEWWLIKLSRLQKGVIYTWITQTWPMHAYTN